MQCLSASKADVHPPPYLPRECIVQGLLCAAAGGNKNTTHEETKTVSQGSNSSHLPGVASKGVWEVQISEAILQIKQG